MRWHHPLAALTGAVTLTCIGLTAHASTPSATIVVSNINETNHGFFRIGGYNSTTQRYATGFKTGSLPYLLKKVTANFNAKTSNPTNFNVWIYDSDSDTLAGAKPTGSGRVQLSGNPPNTAGTHDYNCPSTSNKCNLEANKVYHLVFTADGSSNDNHYNWTVTTVQDEDNDPSNSGWEIANKMSTRHGSNTTWLTNSSAHIGRFSVTAAKPGLTAEPGTTWNKIDEITLTIANYNGSWYYKHVSATGCSAAVTGTTKVVDSLATDTEYTFIAYSDTSCTATLATATAVKTLMPNALIIDVSSGIYINVYINDYYRPKNFDIQWKSGTEQWDPSRQVNTASNEEPWTQNLDTNNGLTYGTIYTIRARAAKLGNTGAWWEADDRAVIAARLRESDITTTGATLSISPTTINSWYYKQLDPNEGTCSGEVTSGTNPNLTGLNPDTSYTYAAYEDIGCTTELTFSGTVNNEMVNSRATFRTKAPAPPKL